MDPAVMERAYAFIWAYARALDARVGNQREELRPVAGVY
jgi:hypothetical protein